MESDDEDNDRECANVFSLWVNWIDITYLLKVHKASLEKTSRSGNNEWTSEFMYT